MGAVFGDQDRLWLRQVEHLTSAMARRQGWRQRRSAICADLGVVVDDDVRGFYLTQGCSRMSLLATRRLARRLAQAPDPRRLAQSVARRRLAAVAAVKAQPTFQLGDFGLQHRD